MGLVLPIAIGRDPASHIIDDLSALIIRPGSSCLLNIFHLVQIFCKCSINLVVFNLYTILLLNFSTFIIWYVSVGLDSLQNLNDWVTSSSEDQNRKLTTQLTHRFRQSVSLRHLAQLKLQDCKFHQFCSLYSQISVGFRVFHEYVVINLTSLLFGGCSLLAAFAFGTIRFFESVNIVGVCILLFGTIFVPYLLSSFIPSSCALQQCSRDILRKLKCQTNSRTEKRKLASLSPIKMLYEPFFSGGKSTVFTILSVCIDVTINLLVYSKEYK